MPTITGSQIVAAVRQYLGDPYVYGAAGPNTFDCSGLVQYVLEQVGFKGVPRTSEEQYSWSKAQSISGGQLQPGDLIFSQWPGDDSSPGHVAIYAGDGKLIEAPKPGEGVHEIAFSSSYKAHVVGYRRVAGAAGSAPGASSSSKASVLGDIAGSITGTSRFFGALLLPETWVRLAAGALGAGALIAGVLYLIGSAKKER